LAGPLERLLSPIFQKLDIK